MSPLEIKERIEALEWEIQNNKEENDAMRKEIKLLEKKLDPPTCPKCQSYEWSYWYSINKMRCMDCNYTEDE